MRLAGTPPCGTPTAHCDAPVHPLVTCPPCRLNFYCEYLLLPFLAA